MWKRICTLNRTSNVIDALKNISVAFVTTPTLYADLQWSSEDRSYQAMVIKPFLHRAITGPRTGRQLMVTRHQFQVFCVLWIFILVNIFFTTKSITVQCMLPARPDPMLIMTWKPYLYFRRWDAHKSTFWAKHPASLTSPWAAPQIKGYTPYRDMFVYVLCFWNGYAAK